MPTPARYGPQHHTMRSPGRLSRMPISSYKICLESLKHELEKLKTQVMTNFDTSRQAYLDKYKTVSFSKFEERVNSKKDPDLVLAEIRRREEYRRMINESLPEKERVLEGRLLVHLKQRDLMKGVLLIEEVMSEFHEPPAGFNENTFEGCLGSLRHTLWDLKQPVTSHQNLEPFPEGKQWEAIRKAFYQYSTYALADEAQLFDHQFQLIAKWEDGNKPLLVLQKLVGENLHGLVTENLTADDKDNTSELRLNSLLYQTVRRGRKLLEGKAIPFKVLKERREMIVNQEVYLKQAEQLDPEPTVPQEALDLNWMEKRQEWSARMRKRPISRQELAKQMVKNKQEWSELRKDVSASAKEILQSTSDSLEKLFEKYKEEKRKGANQTQPVKDAPPGAGRSGGNTPFDSNSLASASLRHIPISRRLAGQRSVSYM